MRNATLVFLIDDKSNTLCLGMKKRGFGVSRWNGFGGKVKDGEGIEETAIREVAEETDFGVKIKKEDLEKVAILNFTFPHNKDWDQQVHVFFVNKWEGVPDESEEMRPKWFPIKDIPYQEMWSDDIYWLPKVLNGEKLITSFSFNENDEIINTFTRDFPLN